MKFDPKQYLFDVGVKVLMEKSGRSENAVRGFIGKCLKFTGDDVYTVMQMLVEAQEMAEPCSFMAASLKTRPQIVLEGTFLNALAQQPTMTPEKVSGIFAGAEIEEADGVVILRMPGKFMADRVKNNYIDVIRLAAGDRGIVIEEICKG